MICPLAEQKPISVNHGGAMSNHWGLVLHVQEGNGSLFGWFSNPAAQVSAHFWCAKDGRLEQYLSTDTVAWAEAAGNPNYLSVETEGFVAEPLTTLQINKLAMLLNWGAHIYGYPVTGPVAHGARGFTQHCNPNGTPDPAWGNHSCPGPVRLGQMTAILARAHQPWRPPQPIPNPNQEDEMPLLYVTRSNGAGFVVEADLSAKRGVTDGESAQGLLDTGLYSIVPAGKLSDAQIDAIPTQP